MKILLIAPASGKWQRVAKTKIFNGKTFRFSLLSLLSVAAETPEGVDVRIVDEQIEAIPWDMDVDLVGITCMTALAPRAYEIADKFLDQEVPVVLGGMHPTLCSEEALHHATAVLAGDADGVWPDMISDARKGCLGGVYFADVSRGLEGLKPPPRHLLNKAKYSTVNALYATRGCANGCDFCSVAAFNKKTHRCRPVCDVIEEVRQIKERFVMFVDDNITADRDYAKELFRALIPMNKLWVSQSTLSVADDPEFIRLAAEAGCIGLFVGLETFSEKNLTDVNKSCHRVDQYRGAIKLLHSHGIGVEAGIVFGFDGDGPEVFSTTLNMLDELEVDLIQASIFTPLPGTPRFETMKGRIIDENWSNYDFHNVVFQPKGMTPTELQAGHDWVTHQFYHPKRIAKRLWQHAKRPRGMSTLPYVAAINMAYYGRITNWRIKGWDPRKSGNTAYTNVNKPLSMQFDNKGAAS